MVAIAALLFAVPEVSAQRVKLNINYSASVPVSQSFKDYVSNTSLRGFNANVLYEINDQWSVGAGFGSQNFYQRYPRAVYKMADGSDLSAVMTNTVTVMPILATGQFNILPEAKVQPYVGLGVGANLVMFSQYFGEFANNRSKFGFAARPEAGVFIPVGRYKESGITVGAAYNFMPFKYDNVSNLNSLGLQAGFKFPLR